MGRSVESVLRVGTGMVLGLILLRIYVRRRLRLEGEFLSIPEILFL